MPSPIGGLELIVNNISSIAKWPDFQFSTEDGRTFGLFYGGESICKRIDSEMRGIDWAHNEDIEEAEAISGGLILEFGTDNPPLVFEDEADLAIAWRELHDDSDVLPTEEEYEYLDAILPELYRVEQESGLIEQENDDEHDAQA